MQAGPSDLGHQLMQQGLQHLESHCRHSLTSLHAGRLRPTHLANVRHPNTQVWQTATHLFQVCHCLFQLSDKFQNLGSQLTQVWLSPAAAILLRPLLQRSTHWLAGTPQSRPAQQDCMLG